MIWLHGGVHIGQRRLGILLARHHRRDVGADRLVERDRLWDRRVADRRRQRLLDGREVGAQRGVLLEQGGAGRLPVPSTQALPMAGSCLSPEQQNFTNSQAASLFFENAGMSMPSPPMCGRWSPPSTSPFGTRVVAQTSSNSVNSGSFMVVPPHCAGA